MFLADTAVYQRDQSALLDDLLQQIALFEVATGLGGLAVALTGAVLARHGWFAPQWLPLTVLVSVAGFMPVAEIGQAGRQLADTIASTRRLHDVESEPEPVTDGDQPLPDAPLVRFDAVRLAYPGRARVALDDGFTVSPGNTGVVRGSAVQAAIAASLNQIIRLPRWRSAAS